MTNTWEKHQAYIASLLTRELEEDWVNPSQEQASWAFALIKELKRRGFKPPSATYPMPDGLLMLDWQFEDGKAVRIEAAGIGKAEVWIAKATVESPGRASRFFDITW